MGSLMDHNFWVMYRSQPLLAYFKGNPLEKTRWVIKDSAVWSGLKWAVDWTPMDESILDTRPYTTSSAYDALNRVRNLTYPEDANNQRQELTPRYNRAGALERIELQGAPVLEHVAYNAKGQRILVARANGFHTRYSYDPVTFRLQRIRTERFSRSGNTYTPLSGNVRQDTGYAYDLGGNILKIKERVTDCGINGTLLGSDALDKTFEYDPLKRLLKATGRESGTKWNGDHWTPVSAATASPNANNVRAYTRRYSYDKVGNVQDLVHQAVSNNYTRHYNYLGGKNQLASIDSGGSPPSVNASFQYDINGNLVQNDTARFYQWNAADQLAYTKLQTSGGPMEIQANYLYDAAGQRVKKMVRNNAGAVVEATVYIDGIFEHRYNNGSQQTSLLVMDGRSRIATLRVGDPMDGNIPYFTYELEDHLGSQVARLDDAGGLVDRDEYYPFGEYSLRQYTVARYGYVGKEYDFETGLNYYGARYYAAWTCRFISVDPLAAKYAHLTPYNYAGNKSIGDLDIDGMQGTGESTSEFPMNPTDSGGNTVNIELKSIEVTGDSGGGHEGTNNTMPYVPLIPDIPVEKGSIWENTVALLNGVKDVVNLVPMTWNSGVANVESLQRGTWTQDISGELRGMAQGASDFVSREVNYAISTPIGKQFSDLGTYLASPEAARVAGAMIAPFLLKGVMPKLVAPSKGPAVSAPLPPPSPLTSTVGELRSAGLKDAHHVIQDAAVRELPGYNTRFAPGVQLPGPSTARGTPHYVATQVQRQAGGGTYAAERRIGYKALRSSGISQSDARQIIQETDAYFQRLGVTPSTPTRIPGNR